MLVKLIIKNIEFKKYFVYMMSSVLFVSVVFILQSLIRFNEQLNIGGGAENIKLLFVFYFLMIAIIAVVFMGYALKCYLVARTYDYGIIRVLGGTQKLVTILLILELAVVFFLSTIIGLFVGIVVSEIIVVVYRMQLFLVNMSVYDILENANRTLIASCVLFVINALFSMNIVLKKNINNVISKCKKKERSYGKLNFLLFPGLFMIVFSVVKLKDASFLQTMLYLVICILGAYFFLVFGLNSFLGTIRKYGWGFYCRHIVTINEMTFRYMSSAKLVFVSFLINFIVLYIVGGMLVTTSEESDYSVSYPMESVYFDYNSSGILQSETKQIDGFWCELVCGEESSFAEKACCIRVSDYKKMFGKLEGGSHGATVFFQDVDKMEEQGIYSTVSIETESGCIKLPVNREYAKPLFGLNTPVESAYIVVVPDECEIPENTFQIYWDLSESDILRVKEQDYDNAYIRSDIIKKQKNDNVALKISSICLGVFSVLCSLAMLALREEIEIRNKQIKYNLLKCIGMTAKQRKRSVEKELLLFWLIPIVCSNVLAWCFIRAEMIRVDLYQRDYIVAFGMFQCGLLSIQLVYYRIISYRINKQVCSEIYERRTI